MLQVMLLFRKGYPMKNPIKLFNMWAADSGMAQVTLFQKWSQIAHSVDPNSDRTLGGLVATIDAMYAADTLSAGQKTDWDAEKAATIAALSDMDSVGRGTIPA
jgi:hypothetical protein